MRSVIPYGRQEITQEDIQAVVEVLQSDWLTQGPKIEEFERKFAEYIGSQYAVAVTNGTAALHLCTLALEVNKNVKVITTPITFAASANCVRYCDGEVLFADINPADALIDLNQVEDLFKKNTGNPIEGIIPVDFAGQAVNLEELYSISEKYGAWILEDACHAPGGFFTDKQGHAQNCGNGKFAKAAIFSFHPVKHIATGEGGMITTNDKAIYDKLLLLRTHGITRNPDLLSKKLGAWYYEVQKLGYNYRLSDINAALGISQLVRADANLQRRKELAARYDKAFAGTEVSPLIKDSNNGHAYHLYVIRTSRREELYGYLKENSIYCQVHYIPVHTFPYYQELGYKAGSMPHAEKYFEECLSLPLFPSLPDIDQEYVIEKVLSFFK